MQPYTTECDDGDLLPTETKELLLQSVNRVQGSLDKAKLKCEDELLVRRGANPSITARHFPLVNIDMDFFTALELSGTLKSDQYERFLTILMDCGHGILEEATENVSMKSSLQSQFRRTGVFSMLIFLYYRR